MVNFLAQDPALITAARESGAYEDLIEKRGVVVGYVPYQMARNVAIISGIAAAIIWTFDFSEKGSVTMLFLASCAAFGALYIKFLDEMKALRPMHDSCLRQINAKVID